MMLDLQAIESYVQDWNEKKVLNVDFAAKVADVHIPNLIAEVKRLQNPAPHSSLTKPQAEILAFISEYVDERGYAPSFEEIQAEFQLASSATVFEHLSNLESKGWISRGHNESRAITVLHRPVRREVQV